MYCEKHAYHLQAGATVRVHFNLHLGRWVIAGKTAKGWRTVHNADAVCLGNARPLVSLATLASLRAAGKRKVCARIEGTLISCKEYASPQAFNTAGFRAVRFNPYEKDCFFYADDGGEFTGGRKIFFAPKLPEVKTPRGARMYQV